MSSRARILRRQAALALTVVAAVFAAAVAFATGPVRSPGAGEAAVPPMTDIHDIKGLMDLGGAFPTAVHWLAAMLGLLVLLALSLYALKRRARQKPPPPPAPPEKAALARLEEIRDVNALGARAFYFQLSAILRAYLQGRYGLNAPEMTTEEILPQIGSVGLPAGLAARLEALLLAADPIKFAAVPASRAQMETDLDFAVAFVEQTTPRAGEPRRTAESVPS